jgi:hypothetical protein
MPDQETGNKFRGSGAQYMPKIGLLKTFSAIEVRNHSQRQRKTGSGFGLK